MLTAGNTIDPDSFKSVHLQGEKQAAIVRKAMAKEKQDWKDKIVVDEKQLHFNVSGALSFAVGQSFVCFAVTID